MPDRSVDGMTTRCPDVETLSAYVDGTIEDRARAEVAVHLAECEDCYELVTEVVRSEGMTAATVTPGVDAAPAPAPVVPIAAYRRPRSGRRVILGSASLLAAAAAVLLVVWIRPQWLPGVSPDGSRRLSELVEVIGSGRPTDGRLSRGFAYAPRPSPMRSGSPSADLQQLALVGEIREAATANPTAENLHTLGVAYLLIGEQALAVSTLEGASHLAPSSVPVLSDLAAAQQASGQEHVGREAFVRARDTAQRALAIDPTSREATFNHALALEALSEIESARAAWQRYLALDRDSPWASEARLRLNDLRARPLAVPERPK